MQLFKSFLDLSKKLNQTSPRLMHSLPFHAQNQQYRTVLLALKIPNLPAPLHYLNFVSIIGRPNNTVFCQEQNKKHTFEHTCAVMASSSPHMAGQFSSYDIVRECSFNLQQFHFSNREQFCGTLPDFQLQRQDAEFSFDLTIHASQEHCYYNKLRLGMADYWSKLCECTGHVVYKGQCFEIQQLGSLEYARIKNLSVLPIAFYTSQLINLKNERQLIVMQLRDRLNRVLQSKIYLRQKNGHALIMCDEGVHLHVHRVYPPVVTPGLQKMYLPREFEWNVKQDNLQVRIVAQSRGDYKFGLGAGYAGSFSYSVWINGAEESGESGYCEYIDCRPLNWQERNKQEKILDKLDETAPVFLKK